MATSAILVATGRTSSLHEVNTGVVQTTTALAPHVTQALDASLDFAAVPETLDNGSCALEVVPHFAAVIHRGRRLEEGLQEVVIGDGPVVGDGLKKGKQSLSMLGG
jgi:hypothetical protein